MCGLSVSFYMSTIPRIALITVFDRTNNRNNLLIMHTLIVFQIICKIIWNYWSGLKTRPIIGRRPQPNVGNISKLKIEIYSRSYI